MSKDEVELLENYLSMKEGSLWDRIKYFWNDIKVKYPDIPLPAVIPYEDECRIILAWSYEKMYLDIHFLGDDKFDWFVSYHNNNYSAGSEKDIKVLPKEFYEHLANLK